MHRRLFNIRAPVSSPQCYERTDKLGSGNQIVHFFRAGSESYCLQYCWIVTTWWGHDGSSTPFCVYCIGPTCCPAKVPSLVHTSPQRMDEVVWTEQEKHQQKLPIQYANSVHDYDALLCLTQHFTTNRSSSTGFVYLR